MSFTKTQEAQEAFSLIEVVIALAIVTFCITSIFGLFAVGLKANKDSYDDTAVAIAVNQVLADLAGKPLAIGDEPIYQFNQSGKLVTTESETYYLCQIKVSSYESVLPLAADHIRALAIEFKWPHGATQPENRIFHTCVTVP